MPRPFSKFRGEEERAADERRAQALERQLAGEISGVATTFVDHSGAPTPGSYLRLLPSRWAGAYQVWGKENREAAIRLIEGAPATPGAANVELKCFDSSANPYLLTGAILAVARSAADGQARLPEEVHGDPGTPGHPQADMAVRLPGSLGEALKALEARDDLRAAAGDQLIGSFAASRRAEIELANGKSDEEIVAQARWLL